MKPILFNTEMVEAILDGRKTVTRRIIKPFYRKGDAGFRINRQKATGEITAVEIYDEYECGTDRYVKPPYDEGDILYVRETWCKRDGVFYYKAAVNSDTLKEFDKLGEPLKWKPSIFMPKEAARIFLRVIDVSVERLQEITTEDAIREGAEKQYIFDGDTIPMYDEIDDFRRIWNKTLKDNDWDKYIWEENPFVWVIRFERCKKPESEGKS